MHYILFLILLLPLHVLAGELQDRLADIKTMSGRFAQELRSDSGEILQQSEGSFRLQQPGKFRWHILAPDEQLLILVDRQLFHYDVELESATLSPVSEAQLESPIAILGGEVEKLEQLYRIETLEGGQFRLEPYNTDNGIVAIELQFEGTVLVEMRVEDKLLQRSQIQFSDIAINDDLPEDSFLFDVPEGVDFIHNE